MSLWVKEFPYALRIGMDICHIPRIRSLLKSYLYDVPKRVLNQVERIDLYQELQLLKSGRLTSMSKSERKKWSVPKRLETDFDRATELMAGR